jgi:hypothetical protein
MGFGGALGSILGGLGSKILPIPGIDGEALGGFLGSMAPFRRGGMIPRANARVGPIPVAMVEKPKRAPRRVQKAKKMKK